MPKFKKKPVEIEAIQWTGDNFDDVYKLGGNAVKLTTQGEVRINTLEGPMFCPLGHYVIKGVKDEIYSCDPEVFKMSYEQVDW